MTEAQKTKQRHLSILGRAIDKWTGRDDGPDAFRVLWATRLYGLAHAIAFANVPGRQNNRNAAKLLNDAVLTAARKVRGWG